MEDFKLTNLRTYYTFDDLLLLPGPSVVEPNEIGISSKFTRNIGIRLPIVSSPMDTVTESSMASVLAKIGTIGVIHRNMSLDREIEECKKVKDQHGGEDSTTDGMGRLRVAAAVGPFDIERARALDHIGVDAIIIDCAHGHNLNVVKSANKIRREVSCDLVVGNIATPEAVDDYLSMGPDAFRVGLGAGSACKTRVVTGVGVPQASAVHEVYLRSRGENIPIIADGGIRSGGDVVKAIALGADSVMLGNLLAGCTESPGKIVDGSELGLEGNYKLFRGMGSKSVVARIDRYLISHKGAPEGVEGLVRFKGNAEEVINELVENLRQGMGYVGAKDMGELKQKARFIVITQAGREEGKPHDVIPIDYKIWERLSGSVL